MEALSRPFSSSYINALIDWYRANKRNLPWRRPEHQNAYAIWLSEIMLQQTQVDTVIPYFERFMAHYPTVYDLASANSDQVLKLWEGLGYYSRAKRLISCAQQVVDLYGGSFPKDPKQMLALPGIGTYTAGAVLSIAYNVKMPAVDGNVFRVLARFLACPLDIAAPKTKQAFENYLMPYLPDNMHDFTQAMMELGATVCTPKRALCEECPLGLGCKAYADDTVYSFPVKSAKKPSPTYEVAVLAIKGHGQYLMYQKEPHGLLGSFWAFPYGLGKDLNEASQSLFDWIEQNLPAPASQALLPMGLDTLTSIAYTDVDLNMAMGKVNEMAKVSESQEVYRTTDQPIYAYVGTTKHIFTHQIWKMHVVECSLDPNSMAYFDPSTIHFPTMKWVDFEHMKQLAITTAMQKNLAILKKRKEKG